MWVNVTGLVTLYVEVDWENNLIQSAIEGERLKKDAYNAFEHLVI
jgi:hypothetical protein